MIRTKHLFVGGALLVTVISTGGIGLMVQRMSGSFTPQSAAIILGTPDDQYAAIVEDESMVDAASFIERIRNSYVPPAPVPEETEEVTSEDTEYVPLPEPETPMPEPLPMGIIEEDTSTSTDTANPETSSSSTAPDTVSEDSATGI